MKKDQDLKELRYPFCPFQSWKVKDDRLIASSSSEDIKRILTNSKIVGFTIQQGLWETVFACSIFEYLKEQRLSKDIVGFFPHHHKDIVDMMGFDYKFDNQKILTDLYPSPLFTLDGKNPIFNLEFNMEVCRNIFGFKIENQDKPSWQIISKNFLFPWKSKYFPQLKYFPRKPSPELDEMGKSYKINPWLSGFPFALILPSKMGYSSNPENYFDLSFAEISSLAHFLHSQGITPIIMDKEMGLFSNSNIFKFLKFTICDFLFLVGRASYLFSNEIDFLQLGMAYSQKAKIFGHESSKRNKLSQRVPWVAEQKHFIKQFGRLKLTLDDIIHEISPQE